MKKNISYILLSFLIIGFQAIEANAQNKGKGKSVKNTNPPPIQVSTMDEVRAREAGIQKKENPTPVFNPEHLGRKPGNYKITIKFKGYANTKVYLADNFGDKQYYRDTCILDAHGVGSFTGNPKLQRGMYMIVFPHLDGYYELPIGNDQEFVFECDTSRDETHIKVIGSEENEAFVEYQKVRSKHGEARYYNERDYKAAKAANNKDEMKRLEIAFDSLEAQDKRYREQYIQQHPTHFLSKLFKAFRSIRVPAHDEKDSMFEYRYYKNHYWDNIDFDEDAMIRAPQGLMVVKLNDYIDKITFQEPDSLIQAVDYLIGKTKPYTETNKFFIQYITNKFQDRKIMCQDNVTIHLINKYYCTGLTWWYKDTGKMCDESAKAVPTMCGKVAPDLNLEDTAGKYHTLYNNLGLYTILFYYDPTCGHCKKVIPIVNDIYNNLKQYGIRVYAVSTENKYDEWRELMRKHPELSGWTNVCKTSREYVWVYNRIAYNINSNPTIFILDKDARIIGKKIDEHQIEFFLRTLLYEKGLIKEKPVPPSDKPKEEAHSPGDGHNH